MHEARSDQDFNPTHQRLNSGVLWALGVPSTTAEVAAAHDEAVQATVAFLERTAVKARTGHNGVHQVDVVALRNRYDLGLLNAASGTVRSIRPETRSLLVQLDRGAERRVPMDYLADGHLTHGYATTIHKAQGLTCDEAFIYADESICREAGSRPFPELATRRSSISQRPTTREIQPLT